MADLDNACPNYANMGYVEGWMHDFKNIGQTATLMCRAGGSNPMK